MTLEPTRFLPLVLYIGPDVLMPVATALAAVAGFLMMFWRRSVALMRRVVGGIGTIARRAFGKHRPD